MGSNWHRACKLKCDCLLLGPFLLPNFWRHTCRCLLVLTIACALGRLTAPWQVGFTGHRTNQCHHPNSKVQTFHSVEYNKTCYLSPDYLYGWFPLDCLGFQHHAPVILQEYQHIPHVPLFFPTHWRPCVSFPTVAFWVLELSPEKIFMASGGKRVQHIVKFPPFRNHVTRWPTQFHWFYWALYTYPALTCRGRGAPSWARKPLGLHSCKQQSNILIKQLISIS